ncbi:hypothetical protein M8C21_010306 [Ambrosia artemisiifolia]|uniref:CCR4-NOT transcription complex subunit 10 n=1 Tax=Ambrosia artemisiifolia TaxID=4212 RepID=A0AAD5G6N4_AMBAR|nr:hypothetical protein M8C21_010306 [Ambrosia artemisiifolia]
MESVPVNNNSKGDASSAADVDIISVTQTLAKDAYVLFQLGKYADSVHVLNQILEKKPDDLKVLHNIAIAENFQDGFSNPKRFLEALDNIKKRSERQSHSSGENAELSNNRIKSVGNKGNNVVANSTATINNLQGISSDDFDASLTMFNIAVILYHLHEYEKCFTILERLYQNIEPVDERVARHVCLLLLEVSLVGHHASRAAAGSVFFKKPLLWLRIAECCIMFTEKKADIHVNVIGKGKWRQLVIESWNSKNTLQVDPNLSLTFAKSCLLNALHLLDYPDGNMNLNTRELNLKADQGLGSGQVNSNGEANPPVNSKEMKVGNLNPLLQTSINEYEGLCGKENQMILQAVLADLAYVYLELGNAVKALAASRCLLRLPECSRVYSFLGNVYAAEAYCLLNQPKQASEHLSSYISGQNSNNTEVPYSQEDCDILQMRKAVDLDEPNSSNAPALEQPLPKGGSGSGFLYLKPEEARGVLLANMAAMAAAEGDMERAHEAVTLALSVLPDNPEVVLTATYIDLVRGKTQDAVLKLKQCSRVRFLSGTLAADK